jgi:hypothetical protein
LILCEPTPADVMGLLDSLAAICHRDAPADLAIIAVNSLRPSSGPPQPDGPTAMWHVVGKSATAATSADENSIRTDAAALCQADLIEASIANAALICFKQEEDTPPPIDATAADEDSHPVDRMLLLANGDRKHRSSKKSRSRRKRERLREKLANGDGGGGDHSEEEEGSTKRERRRRRLKAEEGDEERAAHSAGEKTEGEGLKEEDDNDDDEFTIKRRKKKRNKSGLPPRIGYYSAPSTAFAYPEAQVPVFMNIKGISYL